MAREVKETNSDNGEQVGSLASQIVGKAGRKVATMAETGTLFQVIWRFFRAVTVFLTVLYALFLLAVCLACTVVGERNVTSAFLLYLPPALWVLPLPPLMFCGLIWHRKSLVFQILLFVGFLWLWLGCRLSGPELVKTGRTQDMITIMTYNRGQNMGQSLQPFKNATLPDLLVMQESTSRAVGFLQTPEYSEFVDGRSVGEFTLLSRFPIKESALVPALPGKSPRAARFVIDWNGQPVSVYAVHLQTPREILRSYRRGAFLWGILGVPGTPLAAKRQHNQLFWTGQIEDAQTVLNAVRADPNPSLVAGDFNAPHTGHIHQLITRQLGDAHAQAGSGLGLTFPGTTSNPLSLGGPWMRIDYLFFDHHWQALACITEPDRPSQHRAVAAQYRFVK